jgi:hypothetical protein
MKMNKLTAEENEFSSGSNPNVPEEVSGMTDYFTLTYSARQDV